MLQRVVSNPDSLAEARFTRPAYGRDGWESRLNIRLPSALELAVSIFGSGRSTDSVAVSPSLVDPNALLSAVAASAEHWRHDVAFNAWSDKIKVTSKGIPGTSASHQQSTGATTSVDADNVVRLFPAKPPGFLSPKAAKHLDIVLSAKTVEQDGKRVESGVEISLYGADDKRVLFSADAGREPRFFGLKDTNNKQQQTPSWVDPELATWMKSWDRRIELEAILPCAALYLEGLARGYFISSSRQAQFQPSRNNFDRSKPFFGVEASQPNKQQILATALRAIHGVFPSNSVERDIHSRDHSRGTIFRLSNQPSIILPRRTVAEIGITVLEGTDLPIEVSVYRGKEYLLRRNLPNRISLSYFLFGLSEGIFVGDRLVRPLHY